MENGNALVQRVQLHQPNRSEYDLSYGHCTTMRFGEILPVFSMHTFPGDHIRISAAPFVRCEPMLAPIFGRINVTLHYFFVPNRLLWNNWQDFITGGRLGVSEPQAPYFAKEDFKTLTKEDCRLLDNFSLCRTSESGLPILPQKVSSLKMRGYWKIINDYYRDQNLYVDLFDPDFNTSDPHVSVYNDGQEPSDDWISSRYNYNLFKPFSRAWRKDYFTSALPFPQRGAQVELPVGIGQNVVLDNGINQFDISGRVSGTAVTLQTTAPEASSYDIKVGSDRVGAVGIEDLKEANAIQRWLIRNAVGGGRYNEQILSHFNVEIPDYRIQRPEFIGGVTTPILVSQVLQQSQTTDSSVLGDLAGHGISAGEMEECSYYCYEHGIIIGLMSITPQAVYSQGVHRNDLKFDKFDYAWPIFEDLGEQEIYNAELYAGTDSDFGVFGYAPRYAEYKMKDNEVHGDFRTNLDYWIPQRKFETLPTLSNEFVQVNSANEGSLNNIFSVIDPNQDPFRCLVQNRVIATRNLKPYSNFNF